MNEERFAKEMKKIQSVVSRALQKANTLAALVDGGKMSREKLQLTLEETAYFFEAATLHLRALCETQMPGIGGYGRRDGLEFQLPSGHIEIAGAGWVHMQLDTLLPHCRFQTPGWLSDTVKRLLDRYEAEGIPLPYYRNGALLAIDERSDISGRHIFDQDNKGWKAVSNALKGRIIPDDDQYSLAIALLSTRSGENACGITVLDIQDAGEFFAWRSGLDTRENGWRMD